jgi:hypothetical protein
MSAPSVIGVTPADQSQGNVLGTKIVVRFNQPMNTATIDANTFSLTGPGHTQMFSPEQLIVKDPKLQTGCEVITGTFAFSADSNGNTIATFTPSKSLTPNVTYTVLVVGPGSASSNTIQNTTSESLDSNYQWTFVTGDLDITVPPAYSPLPLLNLPIDPSQVQITQKIWAVGNDLSQEIDITFPGDIDTSTVTPAQILLSLEPLLEDPGVSVPSGLTPTVVISGNTIKVTISGWPAT